MTPEQLQSTLAGSIGVCAFGVLLNLLLLRKRGTSALVMSCAFLVLGLTLALYRAQGPSIWVNLGIAVVGVMLVADVFMRGKNVRPRT